MCFTYRRGLVSTTGYIWNRFDEKGLQKFSKHILPAYYLLTRNRIKEKSLLTLTMKTE